MLQCPIGLILTRLLKYYKVHLTIAAAYQSIETILQVLTSGDHCAVHFKKARTLSR